MFLSYAELSALFDKHWRAYSLKHFPSILAEDARRRAPGGKLAGMVELWF